MRILGIDPGSITTGVGVIDFDRGRLVLVEHGAITTSRGAAIPERLAQIHIGLVEVIARTRPEAVAVEAPFAGKNARSLMQLAQARGVALLAAQNAGLEIFEYSPRSVKNAVVGYGAAEKAQVAKMVAVLLGGRAAASETMSADASDALAVAICHAHLAGPSARLKIRA